MKKKMTKKKKMVIVTAYACILTVFTTFVLLKTFVIPDAQITGTTGAGIYADVMEDISIADENNDTSDSDDTSHNRMHKGHGPGSSSSGKIDRHNQSNNNRSDEGSTSDSSSTLTEDLSYSDDNINITVAEKRVNDTNVYIADVQVSSMKYLRAAFAQNTYGRNIKETTSEMASEHNAILAINGDYYGFRDYGYVIRNGVLYRDTYNNDEDEFFVMYEDGNCDIVTADSTTAQELLDNGVVQAFAFGPGLIKNSQIAVDINTEVDQSMASNPRTAIGMISPLHYVFVVSDGRTSESEGLTLYQLAEVLQDLGCTTAYNLDGGGSTTMYFNGEVINNPTTNGHNTSEREVSDIVYIGK